MVEADKEEEEEEEEDEDEDEEDEEDEEEELAAADDEPEQEEHMEAEDEQPSPPAASAAAAARRGTKRKRVCPADNTKKVDRGYLDKSNGIRYYVDQCVWQPMEPVEESGWQFHVIEEANKGKKRKLCYGSTCTCDYHEDAEFMKKDSDLVWDDSDDDE